MNSALQAHFRLLSSLPRERVRTHLREDQPRGSGCLPRGRSKKDTEILTIKIKALRKKGLGRDAIARELNISGTTVWKHLTGRIK